LGVLLLYRVAAKLVSAWNKRQLPQAVRPQAAEQ
jgi:hypothetical protein